MREKIVVTCVSGKVEHLAWNFFIIALIMHYEFCINVLTSWYEIVSKNA